MGILLDLYKSTPRTNPSWVNSLSEFLKKRQRVEAVSRAETDMKTGACKPLLEMRQTTVSFSSNQAISCASHRLEATWWWWVPRVQFAPNQRLGTTILFAPSGWVYKQTPRRSKARFPTYLRSMHMLRNAQLVCPL